MREDDIRARLSSDDDRVLVRAIGVATERTALERKRADSAARRATTLLGPIGVIAGFLGYFATTLLSPTWEPIVAVTFFATALLLVKAAVFAVRASWTMRGNELTPDFPVELQQSPYLAALREELVWRIWECQELQKVSLRRLYLLNRAQRNFVAGLIAFIGLGILHLIADWLVRTVPDCLLIVLALVTGLTALFLDVASERFGTMWKWPRSPDANAVSSTPDADRSLQG